MTHAEANAKLDRLLRLEIDYDGAGSLPPSPLAVADAREALLEMADADLPGSVIPSVNAGVLFQWDDGKRVTKFTEFCWDGESHSA